MNTTTTTKAQRKAAAQAWRAEFELGMAADMAPSAGDAPVGRGTGPAVRLAESTAQQMDALDRAAEERDKHGEGQDW